MALVILAMLAANPAFVCGRDRVCTRANELRGRYAAWGEIVNRIPPGGFDAREQKRWKEFRRAVDQLDRARKEMNW